MKLFSAALALSSTFFAAVSGQEDTTDLEQQAANIVYLRRLQGRKAERASGPFLTIDLIDGL